MSDFTSGFWEFYIGIMTLLGILACAVLLYGMSTRRVPGGTSETTGHTWDEDLGEYNNPLPRWWVWMFVITIVFSLIYLVLYPGSALFGGTFNWSSSGQYEAEMKAADAQYGPLFQKFASRDIKELAGDAEARAVGQKLFLNHCAQCHASDAGGSRGFPNLTDNDWLYGGEPEAIKASIRDGRNGVMPPLSGAGSEGPRDAAHYVLSLSGRPHDEIRANRGKTIYQSNCFACHGPEGKGNPQLGAPNLTDKIWLHGAAEPSIVETITNGRNSQMPAHKAFLSEAKLHVLAAYVYGLANRVPTGK